MHNWENHFSEFDKQVLQIAGLTGQLFLNATSSLVKTDVNIVTRELKTNPFFINEIEQLEGYSMKAMSRLATLCQMIVYDYNNGPDGDGDQKALRRHWYAWYKVDFAQPYSTQLNEGEFNGRKWAGLLSQTCAALVDDEDVTYNQLWVKDASRLMMKSWEKLFASCHIVLAVEKDSLYGDFEAAFKALGATTLISGKGKQSKAACEKMLREHFGWREADEWYEANTVFTSDEPLIFLHISDHDFDGEDVIGPTFAEQARRYTPHVLEARVGINPQDVEDWQDKWYDLKVSHSGYVRWSKEKALYLAECLYCGHQWPTQGVRNECPECYNDVTFEIKVGGKIVNQPYGFEVEALPTRNYYSMIVDALLEVLPFEYIIEKLRDECQANNYNASDVLMAEICKENDSYQELLEVYERLDQAKAGFEQRVKDHMSELGADHVGDWRDLEDDPEPDDFRKYVVKSNTYTNAWRPFNPSLRTQKLIEFIQGEYEDDVQDFIDEVIEW